MVRSRKSALLSVPILLASLVVPLDAQVLNGRVDSRSAQGVPGAIVRLLHAASIVALVTADDSGHFSFRADTAGDYSVQVERIGYMSAMLGPV